MPSRRAFLRSAAIAGAPALLGRPSRADAPLESRAFVPERAVTREPGHHWFGYYDKREFDPSNRYLLTNRVEFEHRSPAADDEIRIGMVDLRDGDRWVELGTSRAWGWQQGCMLQWVPPTPAEAEADADADAGVGPGEILWNDREGDRFVARVLDVGSRRTRTIPRPIYTISPDGKWGLSLDFARLNNLRPGYGYAGIADRNINVSAPDDVGIWRVDLRTGDARLIVSIAQAAAIPHKGASVSKFWNWFNHLLINPDGTRFIFLHRWREEYDPQRREGSGFITRMFTADADDGGKLHILDPSGFTSHFVWRDPEHVCAWTRPEGLGDGFYLLRDRSPEVHQVGVGVMTVNGHNTYVPGTDNEWILNDTYPQGPGRFQTPYLYHVPTNRRVDPARFHSPAPYVGEWRCDTHPRSSTDGKLVAVDSPHGGDGRQVHLLDVAAIVG